jgi:segregation and condensation protein A
MRAAAQWLNARPVLGQDVFARGLPEDLTVTDRSRLALDVTGLMRAYLSALRRAAAAKPYRPPGISLWSVQQALTRLAALVGSLPDWSTLDQYLPERLGSSMERRGALASTLLAGLEMARGGAVRLRQEAAFGPIRVRRGGDDAG